MSSIDTFMRRDPSKWIIALGFSSLLALMCLITYFSLSQMNSTIDNMTQLINVNNAKIAAAQKMRDGIRERGDALSKMFILNDVFDKEEMRLNLSEHAVKFILAREELTQHKLTARERQLISRINSLAISAKETNDSTAELMLTDVSLNFTKARLQAATTSRDKMLDVLDELIQYQNRYAQHTLQSSVRYHETSSDLIIILSIAAFLFGVLISVMVIRQTTQKNYEIRHQAMHDSLTQLINRKEFEYLLQLALLNTREEDTEHALCYMDLDQFKIINDTCGHDAGDQLLIELSKLIKDKIRNQDTLSRLGGDEFGLLLKNCTLEKAYSISEGLLHLVKNYEFIWKDKTFHVGVSIGLVHITRNAKNTASLMSEADIACYAAKDLGRNRVYAHKFSGQHVRKMHKELNWAADIESSIKDDRFELYVQPIVPITSTDDANNMHEVLLRLRDEDGNIVSPCSNIPAAERYNLMCAVDTWVLQQVIKKLERAYIRGETVVPQLFVNLSANSLTNESFHNMALMLLSEHTIPQGSLCFEITETAAINNILIVKEFIISLKQHDCLFALDDFGTGMSSLAYLKNLPVDYLKIDGSIVNCVDQDTVDQAMVSAVNEIGQVMGIRTIAEHVENQAILTKLEAIGVDYAQGYFTGRPVSINTLFPDAQNKKTG